MSVDASRLGGPLRAWVALAAVGCSAIAGCSADHDFLAQRSFDAGVPADADATTDILGEERRITVPPRDVGEASIDDGTDASEPPEPPGRWTFTLTNGLVDVDAARFCLVPVVGDKELREQVVPVPAGGLPFGRSLVFGGLPAVDPATMGVHPYAVVGPGAGADAGSGCAAMLDAQDESGPDEGGARAPKMLSLPLIPAGTLAEGRSYLAVVTGCALPWPYADADAGESGSDAAQDTDANLRPDIGDSRDASDAADTVVSADGNDADVVDASPIDGATMDVFRRPERAAICGVSSGAPNAGLVLVRLSRRDVGSRFGLQAVHASAAVAGARIAVERMGGSLAIFSADLAPNQIVPRDGLTAVTRAEFGDSIGAAALRIASPVSAFPSVTSSLASALAASGVDEAALMEGDLLSLVLIGAQPGQNPGPPWNAARCAVVRNAPLDGED